MNEKNGVTLADLKKIYKPRLKVMPKNQLINIIIELGVQITELQSQLKALQPSEAETTHDNSEQLEMSLEA